MVLGHRQLVRFAATHEGKVLGQHGDHGILRLGLPQQVTGNGKILCDIGAGGHLDRGDTGHGKFPVGGSELPAAASSTAGAEIRCTTGADHGPLT